MTGKLSVPYAYLLQEYVLPIYVIDELRVLFPKMPIQKVEQLINDVEDDIAHYKSELLCHKENKDNIAKSSTNKRLEAFLEHSQGLLEWIDNDSDAAFDLIIGASLTMRHDKDAGKKVVDEDSLRNDIQRCIHKAKIAKDVVTQVKHQGRNPDTAEVRRGLIWNLSESYQRATGEMPDFKHCGFFGLYKLLSKDIPLNVGDTSLRNDIDQLRIFLQK